MPLTESISELVNNQSIETNPSMGGSNGNPVVSGFVIKTLGVGI